MTRRGHRGEAPPGPRPHQREIQLTDAQRRLLSAFHELLSLGDGVAPTIRELGDRLGIRSPNAVSEHLAALERKGALSRARGRTARAWRITPEGHAALAGDVASVRGLARDYLAEAQASAQAALSALETLGQDVEAARVRSALRQLQEASL